MQKLGLKKSALWRARVRSRATGRRLLTLTLAAPDLRTAEGFAIAKAALLLREDPAQLWVWGLSEVPGGEGVAE